MTFRIGTYGYIAEKNLVSLEKAKSSDDYDTMVFLCEQCLEKILKHYLSLTYIKDDRELLMKSHKLYRLSRNSGIAELETFYPVLTELGNLYFDSRYPGIDYEDVSRERAYALYDDTLLIYQIIKNKIVGVSHDLETQTEEIEFSSKSTKDNIVGMNLFGKNNARE